MTKMPVDTVAMTRRIRDAHYEQLKGKSIAERITFYRTKASVIHAQREQPSRSPAHLEEKVS